MCPSSDTYIRLPVEKYELVSAPGVAFTTRAIARRTAGLALRSALEEWKTTVLGERSPAPSVFSVRWLASYAGLPGTARLWYHRVESCPAA